MPKGLPKWAIQKAIKAKARNVFAYAWGIVKKGRGKPSKALKTSKRTTYTRGTRKVPRRRMRRGRGRGRSIDRTVKSLLKTAALIAPAIDAALLTSDPYDVRLKVALARYTGYDMRDHQLKPMMLLEGWGPYIMVNLMEKAVSFMNRIIRRI